MTGPSPEEVSCAVASFLDGLLSRPVLEALTVVVCDHTNNTAADIAEGRLNVSFRTSDPDLIAAFLSCDASG